MTITTTETSREYNSQPVATQLQIDMRRLLLEEAEKLKEESDENNLDVIKWIDELLNGLSNQLQNCHDRCHEIHLEHPGEHATNDLIRKLERVAGAISTLEDALKHQRAQLT